MDNRKKSVHKKHKDVSQVAIVGIGCTAVKSASPDVSYREMIYEAAVKAYSDAGIEPKDIGSFVSAAEDFHEGISISDEYVPDQLGAVLKPVQTITGDGIHAFITGYMQILTGLVDTVVIETHSKVSNIKNLTSVTRLALDPIYNYPLGQHPYFVAGMEMSRYMHESGTTREQCARVVVKNKRNALKNPLAGCGANINIENVLNSEMQFYPLTTLDIAPHADGATVIVLASAKKAKTLKGKPVWIKGVGWCSDAPSLETREWAGAPYAQLAAKQAYRMAEIRSPAEEIDFAELDDSYSYKELQHLEALGLCEKGKAGRMLEKGFFDKDGKFPVNVSGGCLGVGYTLEMTGLQKVMEVALQLRGNAGERQIDGVRTGIAQSWRGVPTTSGAVVILSA
ncbi:MAG: acetyl-CoA acetyltransferase [bacterium]